MPTNCLVLDLSSPPVPPLGIIPERLINSMVKNIDLDQIKYELNSKYTPNYALKCSEN